MGQRVRGETRNRRELKKAEEKDHTSYDGAGVKKDGGTRVKGGQIFVVAR